MARFMVCKYLHWHYVKIELFILIMAWQCHNVGEMLNDELTSLTWKYVPFNGNLPLFAVRQGICPLHLLFLSSFLWFNCLKTRMCKWLNSFDSPKLFRELYQHFFHKHYCKNSISPNCKVWNLWSYICTVVSQLNLEIHLMSI